SELTDADHPAHAVVRRHKERLRRWIAVRARAAGLARPDRLSRQLMLLVAGSQSQAFVERSPKPVRDAREVERALVAAAAAPCPLSDESHSVSRADFVRVPLLFGSSPVHRLERLDEHLGGDVELWAKREDCASGLAYGGNKVRKLEYLAADALAQGCDTLVSIGGVQSNHTRQVAAVAAHLGLGCVLVQEHWVEWPDPVYDKVGNILLSRLMGADVRLDPGGFDIGFRPSWEQALADVAQRDGKPYAIPAGASDHPPGGPRVPPWAPGVARPGTKTGGVVDTV